MCRSPTHRAGTSPAPASLPIQDYLRQLDEAGYDGWVGLEYKPSGADSADSFGWLPPEQRGGSQPGSN